MYIYNDKTGTVYYLSNFGNKNGTSPAFKRISYMKFGNNKVVVVDNPSTK